MMTLTIQVNAESTALIEAAQTIIAGLVRGDGTKTAETHPRSRRLPLWNPDGTEVVTIKQASVIMGLPEKVVAHHALQDQTASNDLKVDAVKVIRHVRDTDYWKLPYGTPLVGRGKTKTPMTHLTLVGKEYDDEPDTTTLKGSDGKLYVVTPEEGKWYAVGQDKFWDDIIVEADTEEEATQKLNDHIAVQREVSKFNSRVNKPAEDEAAKRKAYDRGWQASVRFGRSSGTGKSPLERADERGEDSAWYDGYHDHAADREKYHSLDRRDRHGYGDSSQSTGAISKAEQDAAAKRAKAKREAAKIDRSNERNFTTAALSKHPVGSTVVVEGTGAWSYFKKGPDGRWHRGTSDTKGTASSTLSAAIGKHINDTGKQVRLYGPGEPTPSPSPGPLPGGQNKPQINVGDIVHDSSGRRGRVTEVHGDGTASVRSTNSAKKTVTRRAGITSLTVVPKQTEPVRRDRNKEAADFVAKHKGQKFKYHRNGIEQPGTWEPVRVNRGGQGEYVTVRDTEHNVTLDVFPDDLKPVHSDDPALKIRTVSETDLKRWIDSPRSSAALKKAARAELQRRHGNRRT